MLGYILIYNAATYTITVKSHKHTSVYRRFRYTHLLLHNRGTKQPFFIDSNLKVYGDILLLVKNNSICFISEELHMDIFTLLVSYILDSQRNINAIA